MRRSVRSRAVFDRAWGRTKWARDRAREIPRLQSAVNICTRSTFRSRAAVIRRRLTCGCWPVPHSADISLAIRPRLLLVTRHLGEDGDVVGGPHLSATNALICPTSPAGLALSAVRRGPFRLYAAVAIAYLCRAGSAGGRACAERAHSSAGQSSGLIIRRSQVRILLGPSDRPAFLAATRPRQRLTGGAVLADPGPFRRPRPGAGRKG